MRQNIQRIDHISMVYYPENVERAVADIERMLGVTLPAVEPLSPAIRLWLDFESGLEVMASLGRSSDLGATGEVAAVLDWLYAHLDQRGEGLLLVVFGVADMDAAVARAQAAGVTPGQRFPAAPGATAALFEHFEEADIGYVNGTYWMLGQIVPKESQVAGPH